jgi:hypothetical protein
MQRKYLGIVLPVALVVMGAMEAPGAWAQTRAEEIPPSFDPSKQPSETATTSDARTQTTR